MKSRTLSIIAGISYFIIFFAAIYSNFFVLESILNNPLQTIQHNHMMVRLGIFSFILTVFLDVVVAWSLYELYKTHFLSNLCMCFRIMHATIMAVAIYTLPLSLKSSDSRIILEQIDIFNTIWLIGLLFFGTHLIILGTIITRPKIISVFLIIAGVTYIIDTLAHFMLPNYKFYESIFLALVAIPSIIGEMSLAIWLLTKSGKRKVN